MSIHILVPQERLAELLKKENTLKLLYQREVDSWRGYHEALSGDYEGFDWDNPVGPNSLLPQDIFEGGLNSLVAKNRLAEILGYEYTVDTDAAYFSNLEDMLGGEE